MRRVTPFEKERVFILIFGFPHGGADTRGVNSSAPYLPVASLSANILTRRHSSIIPLFEQFPVPVVQGRIIRPVSRNDQPRQTAHLLHRRAASTIISSIDPTFIDQDGIAILEGDVVREPLEEIQALLVEYTIFRAMEIDDRACEFVTSELFTGNP